MASKRVNKAPAKPVIPPPADDSGSDVPDLVSESDDSSDNDPRDRPPPAVPAPVAAAQMASKPRAQPVSQDSDSSDEDSDSGEAGDAEKPKKKRKPKKKKPKKKPAAGAAAAEKYSVDDLPPLVQSEVKAPPVKVVDPEQVKKDFLRVTFLAKWQTVIAAITDIRKKLNVKNSKTGKLNTLDDLSFSWAAQKFEYDVVVEQTQEEVRYRETVMGVLAENEGVNEEESFDDSDLYEDEGGMELREALSASETEDPSLMETPEDAPQKFPVELSISVKKWLERQDERYRVMFQNRITQLAAGQRSYALSKRLKHCSFPVYETKLDAGQRILWTQVDREEEDNSCVTTLIVWFAAKHHRVPHLLRLIEHSCGRTIKQVEGRKAGGITDSAQLSSVTARYVVKTEGLKTLLHLPEDAVMLDPQGNIPLKIFPVPDLSELSAEHWRAPLRLNKLEQSVRKQTGAVLLLGRSGTGKTLCLMDRMHHDRMQLQRTGSVTKVLSGSGGSGAASEDSASGVRRPTQLFVARSLQLCELVRRYQQSNANDSLSVDVDCLYMRMRHFLADMEGKLVQAAVPFTTGASSPSVPAGVSAEEKCFCRTHRESDCVDFARFAREIYPVISTSSLLSKVKIAPNNGTNGLNGTSALALDALVVWTQIRSFLKGSIEAVLAGGSLSLEAYLDFEVFGKDRARLKSEQRQRVHELFRLYEAHLREHRLWDDMDRVQSVLSRAFRLAARRSNLTTSSASSAAASVSPTRESSTIDFSAVLKGATWDAYFDKVYVDEVQDYTQAEIAVFLLAVGFKTDSIFLAGDPAQSVVEGVDFRFDEVRSLVHKLSCGRETIQRPIKLLTNYRSHTGVLSCAAAIIDKLLLMFPGSANVLSKDEGLFTGPRPNYVRVDDPVEILQVLGKGVAVLAPDSSAWLKRSAHSAAQSALAAGLEAEGEGESETEASAQAVSLQLLDTEEGAGTTAVDATTPAITATAATPAEAKDGILHLGNIVMGIRAAKGLEFSDVMVLDFFSKLSAADAKAWKTLFAENPNADVAVQDQQFKYPQLEPQLKMLYTAITRSMNRLLFVESAKSEAGEAFFRWLERNHLADKFDFKAAKQHGEERYITSDEWKVRGIQFAGQVDARLQKDAILANIELLDQAILCFTNANEAQLKNVALAQKKLATAQLASLAAADRNSSSAGAGGTARTGLSASGNGGGYVESAEMETSRAVILAGLEKGVFEDVHLLCSNLASTLEPEYLRSVFEEQVCKVLKDGAGEDGVF
uniref:DNA helicase n=1 Tax=Spumella elongata TaxID=89044 RepID=A0A7S3MCI7_9STRA|eukprot:CAMPEP_0184989962 /NCGR_PEP_ID=MMETSP1098-20130426/30589_1 /TAXON_ID=89044 /ORGANISM="Spumella elongata, Strain CCAP 955/1" /LENGTH=1262 /DNA_ID=CAMNT_0027515077 /DNA_START=22 /DNA_END=3810 /DNA_ORIENTATION=+